MQVLPSFDPSVATDGNINVSAADAGCKILLYNLSIYAIQLNFEDGATAILHPGEANWWELDGSTPIIAWSQYAQLSITSPAISKVTAQLYRQDEKIEGTYPTFLGYQFNVGNVVTTSQGATLSIQNDGNASGTQIAESTVVGSPGSNIIMQNQGFIEVLQWIGGVLTQIFKTDPGASSVVKLGANGLLTEVLGNFQIDNQLLTLGNSGSAGSLIIGKDKNGASGNIFGVDGSGNTFIQSHPTNNQTVIYDKNGNPALTVDTNKCLKINGALQTANGDTSGTMAVQEVFSGPVRLVVLTQLGYRQAGGKQMISLKSAFTNFMWIFNGGCGGIRPDSGGINQTVNQVTWGANGADGTSSAVSFCHTMSAGFVNNAVDAIGAFGGDVGGHTGITLCIGS